MSLVVNFAFLRRQRGALFGIDARIALIIFAALSVILGYFSYQQVWTARHGALIREMEALRNAFEQFQADMLTFHPYAITTSNGTNDFNALHDESLVKAGFRSRWNGPYYTIFTNNHPIYGNFTVSYLQADHTSACTNSADCYLWLHLGSVPAAVWTRVNAFFDEADGDSPEGSPLTTGEVMADAATDPRALYFRVLKRLK